MRWRVRTVELTGEVMSHHTTGAISSKPASSRGLMCINIGNFNFSNVRYRLRQELSIGIVLIFKVWCYSSQCKLCGINIALFYWIWNVSLKKYCILWKLWVFINVAVSCRKDIVHVLGDIASSVDASGWPILKPNTFSETKKSKSTINLVCNDTKSIYQWEV